ncbi:MAG TPA: hypothetical protein PK073_03070 [Ignavibacteriaceae bacterium]|jgi:hypothetical protein|nr:MAG: hypothetical protein BWY38_01898 [Ignavibacteria bacterium ADurb.Bin266]HQF41869.1 hypothetical protein [Ignavibacteriaceae bacterium]HQI39834.1 hypothetical protein [Ignavibacteriaceae bacterium]HQJ46702.1 hypothetical protein [Ignavibacteriaceae bacterium]
MTSAKKEFLLSALNYFLKGEMRIVFTSHPESQYSRMIRVNRGGLPVE